MTTLTQLKSWLKTPQHIRRILIEIDNVTDISGNNPTTIYLSNGAYTTMSSDSPSNKTYFPLIVGGVSFNQSLSIDGTVNISYGDIELDNTTGDLDTIYLNLIFVNKNITIYLGDPSWAKSDFKILFRGTVVEVLAKDRTKFNLVIADKLKQLDTSLSEDTVLQTTKNNILDLKPVCFGECFNVTPLANSITTGADAGKTYYIVHNGAIEDIIEVRDMGVPISGIQKDLANGRFRLTQANFGQITCSVQGDKTTGTYTNKIAEIIKNILKNYGPPSTRLVDGDLDLTNFTNFDNNFVVSGNYTRQVGYYTSNTENLIDVCNKIAASVRAKLAVNIGPLSSDSDVGKIKLIKLDSATSATITVTSSDIEEFSISISDRTSVRAATKIAYCKNYTVQTSGLAAGLPIKNVEDFASEWYYSTTSNNTVKSNYKITSEPQQEDTYLVTQIGASTESSLRNSLWSTPRTIYTMNAYPHMFDIQLGDFVKLSNRRFGLNESLGTVVTVSRDWISGRIQLGILV
ncbi:MAG: hypothetical protein EBT26_02030 [Microbacteriaceae bacterium]|nr:hypothetical protein [Microbacteriaceae bacterium]NBS60822.1 hypothetical protein [Microbacteriaceae bacterium]